MGVRVGTRVQQEAVQRFWKDYFHFPSACVLLLACWVWLTPPLLPAPLPLVGFEWVEG